MKLLMHATFRLAVLRVLRVNRFKPDFALSTLKTRRRAT